MYCTMVCRRADEFKQKVEILVVLMAEVNVNETKRCIALPFIDHT